ncbi:envelope stress response membrane protein PspB [Idiomarina tyrosinivorans]|uniref:Envelope stress response membrane protein PspB n=1 Tax=Idiomarina tyrosinivorans TaxID=1445662 RepID=A0A432ZRU4_9GAMM|nr:envelope stress response membrane protein PspB [Idiomarina tyrosinivorans]RUO80630.1 envelope stress response membrane protein PspB [Idiomarina tyrosinivorans]
MDIESIVGMLIAPIILFMIFVAPFWVIMHYRSKRQVNQGLSESEHAQLRELAVQAEKMRERIKSLELILDAEAPQWREKA